MEKVGVCVYRETIYDIAEEINEDDNILYYDNLSYIYVTKEFAEKYYNECVKPKWDYGNFEVFFYEEYTADDTDDFYEYAKEHNAIIDIEL